MNYDLLIKQTEDFVKKYMREHGNPVLPYHNLLHTQHIVSVTNKIAKHYALTDKEFFIVISAAWFLHSGHYKDILHPEEASTKMAEEFLKNSGVEEETINAIKKCILATKIPKAPDTLLEKIICDGDSFYIGTEKFSEYNKLKRKEFELRNNINIDKDDWRKSTIQFFEGHQYYTDYGKEHLNKNKMENLQKLKKKDPLLTSPGNPGSALAGQTETIEKSDKNKKNEMNSPERTIETMFRITSSNSQRLSEQADTKANILISVNAIITSVLLTVIVRRMDEYPRFIIPVLILLFVNLVTIIFSILATRPNIPNGIFTQTDFKQNKVNLLFFGNFFKMGFDDYSKSMLQVMSDRQSLYLNLLRNLHEQGVVLGRKYKMLKTAYNIFMFGLILSVIAFLIASAFFSDKNIVQP
jgi:predicted metal-dependent HD superfamily phosphohydrolase